MFGWRKRNDGFEWHKYVRTTVVARRARRKERLEKAGAAAISGAKSGASHARNGLSAVLAGLWNWLSGPFVQFVRQGLVAVARLLAPLSGLLPPVRRFIAEHLGALFQALGRLLSVVLSWLSNRIVARTLLFVGCFALLAGLVRMPVHGLDPNVLWALAISAVAFAVWGAAHPESLSRLAARLLPQRVRQRGRQFFDKVRSRLPTVGWPAATVRRVAAMAGVVIVAVGVVWFALRDGIGMPELPSLTMLSPFTTDPVKGRATALTGDLIRVGDRTVRLYGVEALEAGQRCRNRRGRWWRCGSRSKRALAGLVNGRTVNCEVAGYDDNGRVLGQCIAGRRDVGRTLIRRGFVFVSKDHPDGYRKLEVAARKARKGFWGSKVQRPSEFRAKRWAAAKREAPDGCPIKGNVTARGKVYVLPWSPNYRRTRIQEKRGERWFCTEREAIQAGWRLTTQS